MKINKQAIAVRAGTGVLGLFSLVLIGKLAFEAMYAGFALAAIGGTAILGTVVYKTLPWLAQKVDNGVWALQKKEARENPVEQMENELKGMVRQAAEFKIEIKEDHGRIGDYQRELNDLKKENPEADLSDAEEKLKQSLKAVKQKVLKYNRTATEIKEFRKAINVYKAQFKLSQMNLVRGTSGKEAEEEEEKRILREEAINSIRSRLTVSLSSLKLDDEMPFADVEDTSETQRPSLKSDKNIGEELELVDLDLEDDEREVA